MSWLRPSRRLHTPDQRLRLAENLPVRARTRNYVAGQRAVELCDNRRRARNLHVCASQTLFRPRRGVHVFLSFLCNTRSAEGKHNEETYCEDLPHFRSVEEAGMVATQIVSTAPS